MIMRFMAADGIEILYDLQKHPQMDIYRQVEELSNIIDAHTEQ